MERFGADVIGLNRPAVAFGIVNSDWKRWKLFDGTPVDVPGGFNPVTEESGDLTLLSEGKVIARMPQGGYYFDRLEVYPGGGHFAVEDVNPPVMSDELCDHYATAAEALFNNTDFAIVAPMGPPYELFYGLGTGGFETWMMALAAEPDYVNSLCEKLVNVWLENLKRFSQAVGGHVQILQFNDDFGTQDAPFISTKMFRALIMPHYKRGLDWVHANTHMKVFLHSDGAIAPLIPSLIEMGVEPFLVSSTMIGAMAQRLVRRVCPKCKESYEPDPATLPRDLILSPGEKLARGVGCPNCRGTGYRGRTGLYELMVMNDVIAEKIIERAPSPQIIAAGRASGLRLLRVDGWVKVRAGATTPDEVVLCTAL